jgi:hypothetical protein
VSEHVELATFAGPLADTEATRLRQAQWTSYSVSRTKATGLTVERGPDPTRAFTQRERASLQHPAWRPGMTALSLSQLCLTFKQMSSATSANPSCSHTVGRYHPTGRDCSNASPRNETDSLQRISDHGITPALRPVVELCSPPRVLRADRLAEKYRRPSSTGKRAFLRRERSGPNPTAACAMQAST